MMTRLAKPIAKGTQKTRFTASTTHHIQNYSIYKTHNTTKKMARFTPRMTWETKGFDIQDTQRAKRNDSIQRKYSKIRKYSICS